MQKVIVWVTLKVTSLLDKVKCEFPHKIIMRIIKRIRGEERGWGKRLEINRDMKSVVKILSFLLKVQKDRITEKQHFPYFHKYILK